MAAVADPLCTDIEPADITPDLERESEVFDAFVKGDSLDVVAVKLGIPYVDAANAIHRRIAAGQVERQLLPELEAARIAFARKMLLPAVEAGDVNAIKEYRQQGESLRELFDANKRPDLNNGPVIEISFAFGSAGRVRMAQALPGSGEDDLRPAHDSLDRDGNEDGKDGSGVGVDLGGDRPR